MADGSVSVSATIDVKPIIEDLKESLSPKQFKKLSRALVSALAKSGAAWVRKRMVGLTMRSGWLKKHIYGFRRSDYHSVVASPRYYGEFLEDGAIIRPRSTRRKSLRFHGADGSWKNKRYLVLPAKKWFAPSIAGFEESDSYKRAVDRTVNSLLAKFEKKPETPP